MTFRIDGYPQAYARLAGAIYLLVILFGGFSEGYVMNSLIVFGDVAATARKILASHGLWQLSVAGNLIVPIIAIVQLWIEYLLMRPVSRNVSLLFLLFNLASLSVEAVSKVFLLLISPIAAGTGHFKSLDVTQGHALIAFALGAHDVSFHITLLLFGFACLLSGYLIIRSRYLPVFVGILMQLAGASYLIASFSELFFPAIAAVLTPWILLPALIGESSMCLWLLIFGVNTQRWRERMAEGSECV